MDLFAPDKDAKTRLNMFCQKYCGRMIAKGDVVYTTSQVQGAKMYQATVQLNCVEGAPVFAGELSGDKKEAEKQAATQALSNYNDDIAKIMSNPEMFKKKGGAGATPPPPKKVKTEQPAGALSGKAELNSMIMKITKKTLTKADMIFNTQKLPNGQFVSTLQLPCMPDQWAAKQWLGECKMNQKEAEHSVSFIALQEFKNDPDLSAKMEAGKKGKTGGDGSKVSKWEWFQEQMFAMMGGGPEDNTRKPVVETPVTGDVVEWKGKFGYIKPHAPVDHPKAEAAEGKVWFSLQDVEGSDGTKVPDWLSPGSMVSFQVYEDGTGEIGANKVSSF